jgi:hypothetical protein
MLHTSRYSECQVKMIDIVNVGGGGGGEDKDKELY